MPSLWKFKKHGQSGMDVSELFPHVAKKVDDIALIRSMHSISNDHGPALFQMNTGFIQAGYPSMGSWVTYGLGTENQNLPAFVVFSDWRGGPIGGAPNWGNGFMPAAYQGTPFRSTGDPIVDLKPPKDITPERQRRWLDLLGSLNEQHLAKNPDDTELSARIQSYELAFRMQSHAVDAVDVEQGIGCDARAVRRRREADGLCRPSVPDGSPAGRARRSIRADLLGRRKFRRELGCSLGPQREPRDALHGDRQADRGVC